MEIKLTKEQAEAFERGEAITITVEPPKPEKWEPECGGFFITSSGKITEDELFVIGDEICQFGNEFKTREAAQKDLPEIWLHNRLLAYRRQYAPDYVVPWMGEEAWYVWLNKQGLAHCFAAYGRFPGIVYFPEHVAKQLADDINSGRFSLKMEG